MNLRVVLFLGLAAAACSSDTNRALQNATGSGGGATGTTRTDGSAGTTPDSGEPGSGATGGGGSSSDNRDSGPVLEDAAVVADTSEPPLVDAEVGKPDAIESGPVPRDAPADVNGLGVPSFIVVLGSSTAAGFGLTDPSTSWAQRYAAYLSTNLPGSRVTNLAVSGYTTFQVQPTGTMNPSGQPAVDPAHNITAAVDLHPDAIIVNLPSNDAAAGVPVDVTMANLQRVAATATQANILIWITTSQPRQLAPSGITLLFDLRDRVEQVFGDRALDFFTPLAAPDGTPLPMFNQCDGIHPNAEGQRLLFEQVRMAQLPVVIAQFGHTSRD